MKYFELEKIKEKWNKEVCLFGAGLIGQTWGYNIVSDAGFYIDCYYDNKLTSGTIINKLPVCSLERLYAKKDEVLVFITVSSKFQQDIHKQLNDNGVSNVINMDFLFLQEFIESVLQSNDNKIIEKYKAVVNDQDYIMKQYAYYCGYNFNLNNPITFNEKLQWLKLNDKKEVYSKIADKQKMKEYVTQRIGKGYVINSIGIWDDVDTISIEKLPSQFVLKCTHDSGSVYICKNKEEFDFIKIREEMRESLKRNYYWYGREWAYKNIKPRIIAEEYLVDESHEELKDYKFFCFSGKAKLIQVDFDRFKEHKRNIYDLNWNYIPLQIKYPTDRGRKIPRPICLKEMVNIAEQLSSGFSHLRVDFYVVNNKPIVGELTLYHGSGYEKFTPDIWNKKLGELIVL